MYLGINSCGKEELNECLIDRYVVPGGEAEFAKVRKWKGRLLPQGIQNWPCKNPWLNFFNFSWRQPQPRSPNGSPLAQAKDENGNCLCRDSDFEFAVSRPANGASMYGISLMFLTDSIRAVIAISRDVVNMVEVN